METNGFLKFVIVVLLALDIMAMAFIWYGRAPQPVMSTRTVTYTEHPPAGKPGEDPVENFICGELKFTDAQCAQYRQMHEAFRDSMDALQQQDRDLHDAFFALSTMTSPDPVRVRSMVDSLAANQKEIELRTFYHFQRVRTLCTPEQAKEFDRVLHEALHMMGPRPQGPPPGGPPQDGRRGDDPHRQGLPPQGPRR